MSFGVEVNDGQYLPLVFCLRSPGARREGPPNRAVIEVLSRFSAFPNAGLASRLLVVFERVPPLGV